ncbi:hypothetical protein RSO68_03440 [Halomonas saccharevitans]|uniref:Uncharacterized protein n=1 Tax=Halomonas saccharevitans TaxID=416872 RepID=A0ABU3NBI7_9GAMM|nr:hypothetical protein [Halomonas saccharevitans]MDT8878519.1 hypothetical protein [Halomonas saccharevitans]
MHPVTQAFSAIAAQLGITTTEEFKAFVSETNADVERHVRAHDDDPLAFIQTPPAPRDDTDAAAIGVATALLVALAIQRGEMTADEALAMREVLH